MRARARAGERDAQFHLAEACERGCGVRQSATAARRWYRAAARQGEPDAAATAWLRQAAEADHGDAQASLATCHQRGRGAAADRRQTIHRGERAARSGSAMGRYNPALCYGEGFGVACDMARAVTLLTETAEQGSARAQLTLGRLYAAGDGVAEDPLAALRWHERGARQGDVKARYNVALLLLNQGDPDADCRAVDELRVAAAAGYAKAMYLLATNYRRGIGVATDRARAQDYLQQAAAAGLAKAQYRLARQADCAKVESERVLEVGPPCRSAGTHESTVPARGVDHECAARRSERRTSLVEPRCGGR
ncbi:MAG: tetratricopeptide repeat protein [Gammaproteobacteria bacterium]